MGLIFPSSSSSFVLTSTSHKKQSGSQKGNNQQKHQKTEHKEGDKDKEVPVPDDKFGVEMSDFSPTNVFWQGKLLVPKDALINNKYSVVDSVTTEIIWELFNGNFVLELLATDRVIIPCHNDDLYSVLGHDALVAACFPDSIYISLNYPTVDEGLGAFHWQDQIEYVKAFCSLLSRWDGRTVIQLKAMSPVVATSSKAYVLQVEQLAYCFYCQMFFDCFSR